MPGGILNGFKSFVERVVPKNLPIPGVGNSDEDEKKDVWDKDLHLYNREGFYYVLIIDSNINDLEREQEILEETGCNVATASTGGEGLDRVSKDKYDLIMIFIDLPRMDGEQTLKNLKASAVSKCRDSKIYAILAETDKKGDQYYLNLGFDGIIRKPTEKCVMEYIIINHAPKKMLPEDERTLEYIKKMAEDTKRLKRCDVRLSWGLTNNENNLDVYKDAARKFCKKFEPAYNAAMDSLFLNNKLGYMGAVREMREEARSLGAIHLADIFDDHVNMAKDDTFEVAQKNWKTLLKEWRYVVTGMADWLGEPEIVPSSFEQEGIKSNGIWISESDMRERVEDIITALLDDDQEYAASMMKLLLEYDFDDLIRRKLNRGSRLMDTDTEFAIEIFRTI